MPAITIADVDVGFAGYDAFDLSPDHGGRIYCWVTFGANDGTMTYPAFGIPLPAPEFFGFKYAVPYRWVEVRNPVTGNQYTYDATVRAGAPYGTLRGEVSTTGVEVATGAAVLLTTLNLSIVSQ